MVRIFRLAYVQFLEVAYFILKKAEKIINQIIDKLNYTNIIYLLLKFYHIFYKRIDGFFQRDKLDSVIGISLANKELVNSGNLQRLTRRRTEMATVTAFRF